MASYRKFVVVNDIQCRLIDHPSVVMLRDCMGKHRGSVVDVLCNLKEKEMEDLKQN